MEWRNSHDEPGLAHGPSLTELTTYGLADGSSEPAAGDDAPCSSRSGRLHRVRFVVFRVISGKYTRRSGEWFWPAILFDAVLTVLLLVNVAWVIIEPDDADRHHDAWKYRLPMDAISVIFFGTEYAMRLWCCMEQPRLVAIGPVLGRLRWMVSPFAVIDLVALLPYITELSGDVAHAEAENFLRVLRVVSLLRVPGATYAFTRIAKTLEGKLDELLVTIFLAMVIMLSSASLMYYLEHDAQPDNFPNMYTSMYWAVTALTTVGYGDISPVTALGRTLACVVAFIGIGFFALPAAIISSGFLQSILEKADAKKEKDRMDRNEASNKGNGLASLHVDTSLEVLTLQRAILALKESQPQLTMALLQERLAAVLKNGDDE